MLKPLTVGSLFAGIGGFDLGLERAGMTITWQVEINPYCQQVLAQHWPEVTRYGDITHVDWAGVEPVDLLCGGFPCQDLSVAGRGAGITGSRSGLWSEYVRAIRSLRPRYVLVENVPGLLANAAMGRVLKDVAESGYDAEWQVLSAADFGAPHIRKRAWIVATLADSERLRSQRERDEWSAEGPPGLCYGTWADQAQAVPCAATEWWAVEPHVGRVAHGVPKRVDRIKGLGNAVVPQIVEWIGRRIVAHHEGRM